jgi:hypothetical protein
LVTPRQGTAERGLIGRPVLWHKAAVVIGRALAADSSSRDMHGCCVCPSEVGEDSLKAQADVQAMLTVGAQGGRWADTAAVPR